MQKRDTATRAFIKYARLGLDKKSMSALRAAHIIRGCSSSDAQAVRLLCVYDTLRILKAQSNGEAVEAVREVYFSGGGRVPRKNDISYAVIRFALSHNMDVRTVWRRINTAKKLYEAILEEQMKCF